MMERQEIASGLRELADWVERNPDVRLPYELTHSMTIFAYSKDELASVAKSLGRCEKASDDHSYTVTRNFGPIQLQGWASRESVCQRVKVGTKVVQKPDPEFTAPLIEVEEDVYEWQCPESLLEATK